MRILISALLFSPFVLIFNLANAQEFSGNFSREYIQDGELRCVHYIVREDGYGCVTMVLDDHDREKGVSVTCKRDTMGNRKIYINTYDEKKVILFPTSYDSNGNIREFEIMYTKREPETYCK